MHEHTICRSKSSPVSLRKQARRVWFGLALASGFASAPLLGQQAPASAETGSAASKADIVVTALKSGQKVSGIGMSIQGLDAERLRRSQIHDLADLTKLVAGFTNVPATPAILTLRGVGYYDTSLGAAPAVSLSIGGVPLPYPILATGAMLDIERIEVLKGPQGTVLGQNSTGGAINFVGAAPTESFSTGGDVEFARFGAVDAQGFVSGPLGEHVRARIALRRLRSEPWQHSYTRDDRLGADDLWSGRIELAADLGERTELLLSANGFRDRGDDQAGQLIAVADSPAVPLVLLQYPLAPANDARAADWTPDIDLRRNHRFIQLSARLDRDLGFARATSVSAWQHFDRDGTVDSDATAFATLDVTTPGKMTIVSQELRLAGSAGSMQWLGGAVYQGETIDDALNVAFPVSSLPFTGADARTHQRVDSLAVFGTTTMALGPDFALEAGLRYADQHRSFEGCTYDDGSGSGGAYVGYIGSLISGIPVVIGPGECGTLGPDFQPALVTGTLNEDNVSWRLGANWRGIQNLLLYANASRGYKSGAFPTIGATSYRQFATVSQESLTAYETGFKFTLAASVISMSGAAFYYDYAGKQFRGKRVDPILGPLDALVSIPSSRVLGAELQLSWNPAAALAINAGGSLLSTRILGAFRNFNAAGQEVSLGGQSFPLSPHWQANLDGEFRPMVSSQLRGHFGGALSYQSVSNSGLGELALFAIPARFVADAHAGLGSADDRWLATLFVRNLTDKSYWNLVSSGPDTTYRLAAKPRTFGIQIGFHY